MSIMDEIAAARQAKLVKFQMGEGVIIDFQKLPGIIIGWGQKDSGEVIYMVEHYGGIVQTYSDFDLRSIPASAIHAFNMRVKAQYAVMEKFHLPSPSQNADGENYYTKESYDAPTE